MSIVQDELNEIREFNSPDLKKSVSGKKKSSRNKVSSPPDQESFSDRRKRSNVIELFNVKSPSVPPQHSPLHKRIENFASDSQDTSELSDDVFVKTKVPYVDSFDKSETKSYRDKINERFRIVKEKAGKSRKKANTFKETAEKILLEKVRRESNDIDIELESVRSKFKLGKTTKNDFYDFFCKQNPQEGEDFTQSDIQKNEENTQFSLPERLNFNIKASEKDLLYKPKAAAVDIRHKIENEEPRYLEDEGFYVPKKTIQSTRQLNLLEQRLSLDDKKWFNCEGKLDIIQNPILKTSLRPQLKPLRSNETTFYLPATIESDECEEVIIAKENILQLQILTLKFTHHPLFSLEHVYEHKLKSLYEEYRRCTESKSLQRLSDRLDMMRKMKTKLEESEGNNDDKIKNYKRDIKRAQELLFAEGKEQRLRLKSILQTWKSIKKIRDQNKYSNTAINLIIKREKCDQEAEMESYERHFKTIYDEIISEHKEKYKHHKKEHNINEEEVKYDLKKKFQESLKSPSEPILHFVLNQDNEITKNVENTGEVTRRNVVSSTKVFLRIICNKMEVCKTKSVYLNDDFCCNFNETVSIQFINIPKIITIEIIEQPKALIKRTAGQLTIKIPPQTVSLDNKKICKENFEKNEIVHYKHEGVGCGIKINETGKEYGLQIESDNELSTSGCLSFAMVWDNARENDEHCEAIDCNTAISKVINKNGAVNLEKLSQWLNKNKPDPQDPRNSILYEYSIDCDQNIFGVSNTKNNYFRLNPYLEGFQFCNPHVLEENVRLKILQLRNKNEPEFDRMIVPNRIKEIPFNILTDYNKRLNAEIETHVSETDDDENEIEKVRRQGKKYVKEIYIKVFQKCKSSENNLSFEDVVDEKCVLQFEKLVQYMINNFINWFRWTSVRQFPPEVPRRLSEEQKLHNSQLTTSAQIIIQVISAINIPKRLGFNSESNDETNCFIEIDYNNTTTRTSTSQGTNPTWNEKLCLSLESLHVDYLNPNSLSGSITINIFDESENSLVKFNGMKSKSWLGYLEIPLSAVCNGGIYGMFKAKTPYLLLGYEGELDKQVKSPKVTNVQLNQNIYINLNITVEPNIPKLTPSIEDLPCSDVPYLKEHALRWNQNYNNNFPDRKFSVFAIDINATTTCIVRYIKPIEPPQINTKGFDLTAEQCARFLSLIPFTDCNQFYQNVWLSVDQLLHFMIGSVIDHAVALTCYLLALKLNAWLILGYGISYGSTAFVLVREYDNETVLYCIYDVVCGEKYNLTDAYCPLQKICCVANEENVWANIQRSDNISLTKFDFTRKSDWLPLFENQISAPTNSVHAKITYLPASDVNELEIILERKIRKKFAKLRQLERTVWNRHVSNTFKSVLSSFENNAMYNKNNVESLVKLKDHLTIFWIKGHVLNLPFTTISSVVKRIKSFSLHIQEDSSAEFASAVYLRSYSNQVVTVWVFIASLLQRDKVV